MMQHPEKKSMQSGVVMIISLLMLMTVTILGIFAIKSVLLSESAAGNTMDKQRAIQAAEGAARYGEAWITQELNNLGSQVDCTNSTPLNVDKISSMRICKSTLTSLDLPWTGSMSYTPSNMTIAAGGGLTSATNSSAQDVNYAAAPQLHIGYLGGSADTRQGIYYQISGMASGGNSNTVSIVQSTLQVTKTNLNLGGL